MTTRHDLAAIALDPATLAPSDARPHVRQLDALTSLRFFAALLVLLFHYAAFFPGSLPALNLIALGYTGVTFFFVLSGFILAHNYTDADFGSAATVRRYMIARLARIYPVYLLALIVSLPILAMTLSRTTDSLLQSLMLSSIVFAPLGLQAWIPGAACALNCPSWSISAEFFFYLVLPFALAPIHRHPARWCVLVLVLWAVSIVALTAVWRASGHGPLIDFYTDVPRAFASQFVKLFPLVRLPEFLLGIVLYAVWKSRPEWTGNPMAQRFLLAALIASSVGLMFADKLPEVALHNGLTAVVWCPLIVWAASLRSGLLNHPSLIFLGRISFSLYLLHLPIALYVIVADARLLNGALTAWPAAGLALATALSIAIAAGLFMYLEEPARRAITRRWANGSRTTVTSSSAADTAQSRETA